MILKLGAAQTLLLAAMVSQGTPVVTADVASNPQLARFVGALAALRRQLPAIFTPLEFETPRVLQWHGPAPGAAPFLFIYVTSVHAPQPHTFRQCSHH